MNDETIRTHILDKLEFEPGLMANDIIVFVKDAIVVLSGRVRSYAEKHLAEETVKNVRGVKAVAEEIIVDLHASLLRSDVDIAQAIVRTLEWDVSIIPPEKIKVVVENGNVELTGEVDDYYQKERAFKCIRYLYGVKNIVNRITFKPPQSNISAELVSKEIMKEFHRNASIDAKNIIVQVDGSMVTLKGKIHSWFEKREAEKAAWSVRGVSSVKVELTLSFS
ncbi:MAG: BON domain-containing protein [Candidatus Paracaedibacteraceae bacterium]|nr:BON domain-containing protein [Candidatus Paracaedibacteraceae bacterium]